MRSSDGKCLVLDIEPTGKDKNVTKIGKDVYRSADEAEGEAKRLCKDAKPAVSLSLTLNKKQYSGSALSRTKARITRPSAMRFVFEESLILVR